MLKVPDWIMVVLVAKKPNGLRLELHTTLDCASQNQDLPTPWNVKVKTVEKLKAMHFTYCKKVHELVNCYKIF